MVMIVEVDERHHADGSMDHLTDVFSRSLNIRVRNNTPYDLYIREGAVYSGQTIRGDEIIGEIMGDPSYIWELNHNSYIIIDREFVLDTRRYNDSIISYVREENETSNTSNCFVRIAIDHNGQARFLLVTKKEIQPCEELVYSTFDFENGNEM
jgi:hypothetical protein